MHVIVISIAIVSLTLIYRQFRNYGSEYDGSRFGIENA